jgi:photosystem II stability/assembly factor-like uncharacterized protein
MGHTWGPGPERGVFRTRDEGMNWEVISPDLTHNLTDKMEVAGTPWLPEYFGQEVFSTIHRLEESPHEQGMLWAGSDDGRVHLTRNGGESWASRRSRVCRRWC